MLRSLKRLQKRNWIDDRTRMVFVEFTVFNPTTSMFVTGKITFECDGFGTVAPYSYIVPIHIYHLTDFKSSALIMCGIVFLIYLLWFTYNVGRTMFQMRQQLGVYMTSVWTLLDWLILVLSYGALTVFVERVVVVYHTMSLFRAGKKDVFISFNYSEHLESLFVYFLAIILTLLTVSVLKLSMYVSKRQVIFTSALSETATSVAIISIICALTFLSTLVMSRVLFSDSCGGYSNMSSTIVSVLKLYIYQMSNTENACVNNNFVTHLSFFGMFMFVLSVLWLPFLIVCGVDMLIKPKRNTVQLQNDLNFVNFLWSRFLVWTGYWRLYDFTKYVERERIKKQLLRAVHKKPHIYLLNTRRMTQEDPEKPKIREMYSEFLLKH